MGYQGERADTAARQFQGARNCKEGEGGYHGDREEGTMHHYTGIGARATPQAILDLMRQTAEALAAKGYTLRSGHAHGADSAFEAGAAGQSEIYLPSAGWRNSTSDLHPGGTLAQTWAAAEAIAARHHPAWPRLKPFVRALHTRNVYQVMGRDLQTPSRFLICWTADGEATGGTGQAIRIAETAGIAVINLQRENHRAHVRQQLAL